MDNYRAWFWGKTNTFKADYCNTVDNYADQILGQIDAFTSRTGYESPQEVSRMLRHMEVTHTFYQNQLNLLEKRYFAGKATFTIPESTSAANPNSDPNTGNSDQVSPSPENSTNQPQQANTGKRSDANVGVPKDSDVGVLGLDSTLSDSQFVSLSPSNQQADSQLTLSSPLITSMAPVDEQQESTFMDQPGSSSGSAVISQSDSLKRTLSPSGSEINSKIVKRARASKTHTCITCGRNYRKKSSLLGHQLLHRDQERARFPCTQCDRVFIRKDHLSVHLRSTHGITVNARCTWNGCTYTSWKSSIVIKHIRTVHFKLPKTVKLQTELGITDARNPRDFIEKI